MALSPTKARGTSFPSIKLRRTIIPLSAESAYADMLAIHDLADQISARTDALPAHDVGGQARIAQDIRDLIGTRSIPVEIAEAIRGGYAELCDRIGQELPVAVRSSGTAEDLPDASFAGQGDTYLWTVGADAVIERARGQSPIAPDRGSVISISQWPWASRRWSTPAPPVLR